MDAIEWAKRAVDLGAGELLVTSIEQDGTGRGLDLELTRAIAAAVPIPVIAAGGAGRVAHVSDVIARGAADAVCVASLLHYHYARQAPFDAGNFQHEGNVEHLRRRAGFGNVEEATLADIKEHLLAQGIGCRRPETQSLTAVERA